MKKKTLSILIILALITIIVATSFEITPVKAQDPKLQDPTPDEKTIFQKLRNRYKDLGQKSVNDILNSLGADGKGQWVSIATKECHQENYDSCEIIIETRLVRFDPALLPPGWAHARGGCGTWGDDFKIEDRVKKLQLTLILMLNSDPINKIEKTIAGQVDNDRVFYHELLHGQLAVDEMKKPDWAGWNKLCECTPLSEWIEIIREAQDPSHAIIPGLDVVYRDSVAIDRGLTLFVEKKIIETDENRGFSFEIEIPDKILEKEKDPIFGVLRIDKFTSNVEGEEEGLKITRIGNKLTIEGKLKKGETEGEIGIYIDPINVGMIINVDILWSPEAPVGGISVPIDIVPVDKFGLLAPYIGLASTILFATAATAIYVKRVKRGKEKQ